jgi:peptide/nickel transport system substrate-binding protein
MTISSRRGGAAARRHRGSSHAGRWVGVGMAAATLIVACSGNGSGVSTGSARGGVLRYGYDFSSQFTNLDPGKSTGDCDAIAIQPIFDTLVHRDAGGNILPGQAESWDIQGNTLTLHLRSGITFSDGEPFDANAVKLGLEHLEKNTSYSDLGTVTSIDVLDPMTVRITLNGTPPIELLYSLSTREGMIVAPDHIADASTHPVGAGPFVFQSFTPGAQLSLRANPTFWDKGLYKFGGIDFTQVGVGPPSVTALKAGSVDMVSVQPESYSGLKGEPSVGIATQTTTSYLQFQFRFTPPFDNLDARQAVEFAVNRAQINQVVQDGLGEVANQTFFKASLGYNRSVAALYDYDPAKAHQMLVQSGLPLPVKIEMVIPGGNISSMEDLGAIIQQELDAVGFSVTLKRVLGSDIEAGYYLAQEGNAFAAERPGEPYAPVQIYDQWGSNQFVAIWSKGERPDITSIILQALSATSQSQAAQLTQQAEAIVTQQALDVPIAFAPELMAYSTSTVGGAVHAQTGVCDAPDLTGVTLKKS